MKKFLQFTILIILMIMALTACSPILRVAGLATVPPAATPQEVHLEPAVREAQVQSVEIQFTQTDPVQVYAIVRGNLTESCATFADTQLSYADTTFQIKLLTKSPSDRGCIQVTTPYEQKILLDITNLAPGTYTVTANGFSTGFNFPIVTEQPPASLKLVVRAKDGTLQVANLDLPLNPTARPTFNNFLSEGGGAEGAAYVLDYYQYKAVVTDGKDFHDLVFVQSPTIYGLAVFPGGGTSPSRLAWATQISGDNQSSTIKISSLDGTYFDTLLTQDAPDPLSQLMAQFFSADGQWLYFSKEPLGIGGYILFGGGSNLYKINVTTKEVIEVIPAELSDGAAGCLDAISADFRYVADHCAQNTITIRDLSSGDDFISNPPAELGVDSKFVGQCSLQPRRQPLGLCNGER